MMHHWSLLLSVAAVTKRTKEKSLTLTKLMDEYSAVFICDTFTKKKKKKKKEKKKRKKKKKKNSST